MIGFRQESLWITDSLMQPVQIIWFVPFCVQLRAFRIHITPMPIALCLRLWSEVLVNDLRQCFALYVFSRFIPNRGHAIFFI